jgi:hypothetical protein
MENFLEHVNKYSVQYMDSRTCDMLNEYIRDSGEIDTDDWEICDFVRIPCSRNSCYDSDDDSCDVEGLFIWDGNKVIYPFYGGHPSSGKSKKIDTSICKSGYIPDNLILYADYYPDEVFNVKNGLAACVGFGKIINDDNEEIILSNMSTMKNVKSAYNKEKSLTVCNFGPSRFVVFFGIPDTRVINYLKDYRPFDLDMQSVISKYNMSIQLEDLHEFSGGSDNSDYLFIHPSYLTLIF